MMEWAAIIAFVEKILGLLIIALAYMIRRALSEQSALNDKLIGDATRAEKEQHALMAEIKVLRQWKDSHVREVDIIHNTQSETFKRIERRLDDLTSTVHGRRG